MDEIWKSIEGYENRYEVSNLGNVRSLDMEIRQSAKLGSSAVHVYRGKILKQIRHKNGYLFVCLSNMGKIKQVSIHRLVAQAFIANIDNKPQVNHIDGNKENNSVDNLEWCTAKENTRHADNIGLRRHNTKKQIAARKKSIQRAIKSNMKSVSQYTTNGKFIASYESIKDASIASGANATHICLCALGKHKTSGGYVWRYAE